MEWNHLEAQDLLQGGSSVLDGLLSPLSLLLSARTRKFLLCPCLGTCSSASAAQTYLLQAQ